MPLLSQMSCRALREEELWMHVVTNLLRLSRSYATLGAGGRALKCEAILIRVEAFLKAHGQARHLAGDRILKEARRRAHAEPLILGSALREVVWENLAQWLSRLSAFSGRVGNRLGEGQHLDLICRDVLAMARSLPTDHHADTGGDFS